MVNRLNHVKNPHPIGGSTQIHIIDIYSIDASGKRTSTISAKGVTAETWRKGTTTKPGELQIVKYIDYSLVI